MVVNSKKLANPMPNKRSRRRQVPKFFCPHCQQRLWRKGGSKYYLHYQGQAEIKKAFKLSAKKASFLANQHSPCVNLNVWLEEFFCAQHGNMWLHLCQNDEKTIASRLARAEDWQRTGRTVDPDHPHVSVSEFTYKMSRGTRKTLP